LEGPALNNYLFPFEKLEIWRLSIELSVLIYKETNDFPQNEKFGITNQLRRAANSKRVELLN